MTEQLFDYDAELRPHNAILRAAARVGPREQVLDIGCGTGQTTREAARIAAGVLGVDINARMLDEARRLSAAEGLTNLDFQLADAQTHEFPPGRFDLCLSRFGLMFFADPLAAFGNIRRALRPGARLVALVWQARERNEWAGAIRRALTDEPAPATGGPDAFSLADPATTEGVLTAAGFTEVEFTEVREPVHHGPDSATAFGSVLRIREYRDLLAGLDPAAAEQARGRLRAVLTAHETDGGVHFGSRAWLVTARAAACADA